MPRPLLDRAIHARGGQLHGIVIRAEAQVHTGAPGRWQWTRAFLTPDRYAWKIVTAAEPHYHLYDCTAARSFIGSAEVSSDASPNAPLRSHARWMAVTNLDGLHAHGVALAPLPASELPAGATEGLVATLADGTCYRLAFDARTLLVWAQGPLDFSPVGKGDAVVRFGDHRRTGGLLLPFITSYALGDGPLADERALAICVDPAHLTPESFTDPAQLPDCP